MNATDRVKILIPFGIAAAGIFLSVPSPSDKTAGPGPERAMDQEPGRPAEERAESGPRAPSGREDFRQREVTGGDALEAFENWLTKYRAAPPNERAALLQEGRGLAAKRHTAFLSRMRNDPESALKGMLPLDTYASLPEQIAALIERPFASLTDIDAVISCHHADASCSHAAHYADLDGVQVEIHTYGQRGRLTSKQQVPVFGARLGDEAVVADRSLVPLSEIAEQLTWLPGMTGQVEPDPLTGNIGDHLALFGSRWLAFESMQNLRQMQQSLTRMERMLGRNTLGPMLAAMNTGGVIVLPHIHAEAKERSKEATRGEKKILVMRLAFQDRPGEPVSKAALELLHDEIDTFFRANSYGQAWLNTTVSTNFYTLPQNEAYYDSTIKIRDDSQALAGADFTFSDYDALMYVFPLTDNFIWGGLAFVGGTSVYVNGHFENAEVIAHELGHNYGLNHAGAWNTTDDSIDGPGWESEYGDVFDLMGTGGMPRGHFSMVGKELLGWLTRDHITHPEVDSLCRIHAFDSNTATTPVALKVTGGDRDYWFGLRHLYASNDGLKSGAYALWATPEVENIFEGDPDSRLLDASQDTTLMTDSALLLGQTLQINGGDAHVTPVALGEDAEGPYMDLQVLFGDFSANQDPTGLAISGPTTGMARANPSVFTATASDPDSDPLFYNWDFGDGSARQSGATAQKRWSFGGTYTVTLTVSDARGGTATATTSVTVSEPISSAWTAKTLPSTTHLYDMLHAEGLYVACGTRYVATSPDGDTWTRLPSLGEYHFYGLAHDGSTFVAVGENFGGQGTIHTSDDGVSWSLLQTAGHPLRGIVYAEGRFVAVGGSGSNGLILTSTDGSSWSEATLSRAPTRSLQAVTWGDGNFVTVGEKNMRYHSADGLSWTANSLAHLGVFTPAYYAVLFESGRFTSFSGSVIGRSDNGGATWAEHEGLGGSLRGVARIDGIYMGAGGDTVSGLDYPLIVSEDLANWSVIPGVTGSDRINRLKVVNGRAFALLDYVGIYEYNSPSSLRISVQPTDSHLASGATGSLSVSTGDPSDQFQWYEGESGDTSTPVSGATTSSLQVSPSNPPGRFWVRVSNGAESVDSSAASVFVNAAPVVAAIPDLTTPYNTPITVNVNISDDRSPLNALMVTAEVSDDSILPADHLTTRTVGSQFQLVLTPGINAVGHTTVDLTVEDEHGLTAQRSFGFTSQPRTVLEPEIFVRNQQFIFYDERYADPYPSRIPVSGLEGNLTKVAVGLNGFTHRQPQFLNILVRRRHLHPHPEPGEAEDVNALLMARAGSFYPVEDLDLQFEHGAGQTFPSEGPMTSGIWEPSFGFDPAVQTIVSFHPPGPMTPFQYSMDALHGTRANGTWELYVDVIDSTVDLTSTKVLGGLRGWHLKLWTDNVPLDTDGDKIPDSYEDANGMDKNDPVDALLDGDGDGMNALEEFGAGTDLNDSTSLFKMAGLSQLPSGNIEVQWDSVAGQEYSIWTSPNLKDWTEAEYALPATAPINTHELPDPGTDQLFIRVGSLKP